MRIGMVGTDILHAWQYACAINTDDGPHPALPAVEHDLEVVGGGEPAVRTGDPHTPEPQARTGAEVRSAQFFGEARVVAWWDVDRDEAQRQAATAGVPEVTETLAELVDRVDAGMVCTWHGETHHALARPFLERGKPVFIDKPLCHSVEEAKDLREVAEETGTFFFSSSPWKWSPVVEEMVAGLPKLGALRTVVVSGPAVEDSFFYVTHLVELLQRIIGSRATAVRCVSDELRHMIEVRHESAAIGIVNGLRDTQWIRHTIAYGQQGYLDAAVTNRQRDEGMVSMLRHFVRSVESGVPPLSMKSAEESVRVMVAAERSSVSGLAEEV